MKLSSGISVALGAALWSLDSIFRHKLIAQYSPLLMVVVSQTICSLVVLPLCWLNRANLAKVQLTDWLRFLFIALFSNLLAMLAFTYAFSITQNYSVPILVQKLQPIIATGSAVFLLKEKLPRFFYAYALMALVGSFLLSFTFDHSLTLQHIDLRVIFFSLIAALFWGLGTTVGKDLSNRHSASVVTALRYGLSLAILFFLFPLWRTEFVLHSTNLKADIVTFAVMALVPGFLALFIYYRGLQKVPASIACWLELSYPLSAIIINWVFLGSTLSLQQLIGTAILLLSVTLMAWNKQKIT